MKKQNIPLYILLCTCLAGASAGAQEAVSARSGEMVEVRVDAGTPHQTLRGFGACFFMHDITDYCSPKFYDDLVFDLGVTMVRYPMPIAFEPPDAENPRPASERVSRDAHARQMAFVRSFIERGVTDVFSTPWSPPAWMKTNRHIEYAGHLRPDRREDFAEFISGSIRHLKEEYGLELAAVSIQNELAFPEPYGSCVYNGHSLRETVRAVMRKFDQDRLNTQILFHEDLTPQPHRVIGYIRPVMADAETSRFPGHFAVHHSATVPQWQRLRAALDNYYGREMWQTETSIGGADWPRNLNNVRLMHNGLAGGNVSVWTLWQFGMLHAGGQPTSNYTAFKHFFRFVRPGAQRIESSPIDGDVVTSAWRHDADGNLTIVALNQSKQPVTLRIDIAGVEASAFRMVRSSAKEKFVQSANLPAAFPLQVEMPAESIITLQSGPEIMIPRPESVTAQPPIAALIVDGDELLHKAARRGNVAEVESLLAAGRDPNAFGVSGWTPLHRAAFPGHTGVVGPLVKAGADPNLPIRGMVDAGDTPLHIAAAQGRLAMVKELLAAGAVEKGDGDGWTPLHRAALGGKADVAKYLIEQGFDVKARAKDDWTPLHAAAGAVYDGSFDILEALLTKGADPNARDRDGWTALHAAAAQGMIAHRHDTQLILRKIDTLLASGAELEARDADDNTPLHWAAWIGFMRGMGIADWTVDRLLSVGADPNAANAAGRTPLHHAVDENYAAIAQRLDRAGANRELADKAGVTPEGLAKQKGFHDIFSAREEEEREAPRGTGKHGTALRQAVDRGDLAKVKALLTDGADPNAQDHSSGIAPLHIAVRLDRADIVKVLLDAGALPDVMNRDGVTALTMAEWNRQTEILELLKAAVEKKK